MNMRKMSRKVWMGLCLAAAAMCVMTLVFCTAVTAFADDVEPAVYEELADSYNGKTVIVSTNDVHGAVDGYQYVAGIRDELKRRGADVYLVDSGDFMQGDIYVAWDMGKSAIDLMNTVKYDLATIGNHEFDYTFPNMKTVLEGAAFPVICDDMIEDDKGAKVYPDTYMIENGNLKIGFFGVDTPSTKTESAPKNTEGVSFFDDDSVPTIYKQAGDDVLALRKDGADVIIGMTHLGVLMNGYPYRSYDLWNELNKMSLNEGVEYKPGTPVIQPDPDKNAVPDFILDGHSHTVMSAGINGEPIMQTGTKLANVGIVVIDEKTEKIEKNFLYKVDDIKAAGWSDADVKALSDDIKDTVDRQYAKKVCESRIDLNGTKDKADAEAQGLPYPNGNRDGETNFGDLVADSMVNEALKRIKSGEITDIAADHVVGYENGGGIRANISTGDVSKKDILSVLPWSNTVCGVYVQGSDLLEVLEASTFSTPVSDGGFPQVSGITYTINTAYEYDPLPEPYPESTYHGPASIRRVTINDVNGKPFSPADTYLVMTNNFCADGGNACYLFGQASKRFDTGATDFDALVSYIKDVLAGVINVSYKEPAGRIRIVNEPAKSANPMKVSVKNKTVKYRKVKKSAVTVKPIKVTKAKGTVTYTKTSGSTRISINKKTGAFRIKKGTKKGLYKIKVLVKASGNEKYKAKTKNVKVNIRIK